MSTELALPKTKREKFLNRRRTGIGGSDIGAIVGVHPFKTALDVYFEKIGEPRDEEPEGVLERGLELEPIIRKLYAKRSGRAVRRSMMRRHKKYSWAVCNPDGIIQATENPQTPREGRGVWEGKTCAARVIRQCEQKGVHEHYRLQLQWNLGVTRLNWGVISLLNADYWKHFDIEEDADYEMQRDMWEIGEQFWHDHVLARKPPAERDWRISLPAVEGIVEDRKDEAWERVIQDHREATALAKDANEVLEQCKEDLKTLCGRHGVFEGARARVYFRQYPGKESLKMEHLEAAGLIDPMKLLAWAMEHHKELVPELQAAGGDLRADISDFKQTGKPYERLRVYHNILEE